jgi:RNA polymerase sigma factor (sigma-70 family)
MTTLTGSLTDRQLLERFATQRDEEGFAQLLHRYGPMVLAVCRQILRKEQDAEDAFQATFLVLSRKAGSIRSAEALPSWLYGVASRLAKRMRAAALRRQAREVALVEPPTSEPGPGEELGDLGPVLHEEIGRLPDKYRLPFVLCYLDGKTNEEAAQELGCPPGTVYSRLARARERLRARLRRRGVVVASGAFAAVLARLTPQASAAVPPPLVSTTVRAAVHFGAGNRARAPNVPARVMDLARWGVWSLSWRRLRMGCGLLLLVALVGALSVLVLRLRPVEHPIQNRLQGTWVAVSMNMNGIPGPAPQAQVTFKDNQMTFLGIVGTYRIDAAKDPMQLDWTVPDGTNHWIFQLHGDELTLCTLLGPGGPGGRDLPRPRDFSPQPGKIVTVFRHLPP